MLKEAASQRQGLPLLSLSWVGDLSPSWVQSWVGARSYCWSQTLLLGRSSSQPPGLPRATENLLSTVFCLPTLQVAKLQNWAEERVAAGTTWDFVPSLCDPTKSWAIPLGLHTLSSQRLQVGPPPALHISPRLAVLGRRSCCKVVCLPFMW